MMKPGAQLERAQTVMGNKHANVAKLGKSHEDLALHSRAMLWLFEEKSRTQPRVTKKMTRRAHLSGADGASLKD